MTTLAANPRRLGADIGGVAVLHTWGQALTHHPHLHCVVPGGGLSPDATGWIAGRPNFFLAVKPLAMLFRRLFLDRLTAACDAGTLGCFGERAHLADPAAIAALIAAMRRIDWVVYAKKPFGGPAQVLAYLGRYTHRVAIANRRIVAVDDTHVAFTWKDHRHAGATKLMRLEAFEVIRRFLLHTLPDGFHRIRHFGFMANSHRAHKLALCRSFLLDTPDIDQPETADPHTRASEASDQPVVDTPACPCCGATMRVIAILLRTFEREPSHPTLPMRYLVNDAMHPLTMHPLTQIDGCNHRAVVGHGVDPLGLPRSTPRQSPRINAPGSIVGLRLQPIEVGQPSKPAPPPADDHVTAHAQPHKSP